MLSQTEQKLIELRLVGYSRKEIAYKTFRSELTVKTHFQNIHKKLRINEEVQMFTWYLKEIKGIDLKKLIQVVLAISMFIMIEVMANYEALRTKNVKAKTAKTMKIPGAKRSKSFKLKYA